jgi:hypothetical protein
MPVQVKDIVLLSVTVLAFALLVTVHLAIALGLLQRPPRSRALLAFVVAPLAPYFALRERMTFRAVAWIVSAAAYLVVRWLGRH